MGALIESLAERSVGGIQSTIFFILAAIHRVRTSSAFSIPACNKTQLIGYIPPPSSHMPASIRSLIFETSSNAFAMKSRYESSKLNGNRNVTIRDSRLFFGYSLLRRAKKKREPTISMVVRLVSICESALGDEKRQQNICSNYTDAERWSHQHLRRYTRQNASLA